MSNAKDAGLVSNRRNTSIGTDGSINRAKLRVSDALSSHKRSYLLARSIHTAYGKLFGWAHTLPDVYIIGFAKCGTTSLYEYMIEHPDMFGGFVKEVHFFDHSERYMRGINWYRSNFMSSIRRRFRKILGKKTIVIDGTPRYVNHPHAMRRIIEATPNAKFIAILRNPIERAYSQYAMNVSEPSVVNENLEFGKAIEQESERISGEYEKMEKDESYYSTEYYGHGYAEGGLYYKWLQPWLDEFRDRVLVLDTESLDLDAQKTLDDIVDFVGLDRYELQDIEKHNVGKGNSKMDSETRLRLEKFYEKPNTSLYSLLERDFGYG